MELSDQLGNTISIPKTPERIVCLVPSLTELLVDLGLEYKLVGVTKFCVHPKHVRKTKTIVGGTKNIKIERLKGLNPDFILCNKEENTEEIVAKCRKFAPTYVSDITNLDNLYSLISSLGNLFDCKKKAKELKTTLKRKAASCSSLEPSKNVAYFIWKDPWMVVGKETFINYMLEINGFKNIFSQQNRYPEINLEKLKSYSELNYIFLSSEPFPFKESHVNFLQKQCPNVKIILVDGEYFSWYGSRLILAFDYFETLKTQLKGNISV